MKITSRIKTEEEYREKLRRTSELFDAQPASNTPEGDELDLLLLLVEDYESRHHAMDPPTPIEAIKYAMEALDMNQSQLASKAGIRRSHLSEVLNSRRSLSLRQIRSLSKVLDIPVNILVQEYSLDETDHAALHTTTEEEGQSVQA